MSSSSFYPTSFEPQAKYLGIVGHHKPCYPS